MRPQELNSTAGLRRIGRAAAIIFALAIAVISGCQNSSSPPERPTLAVLPVEARDAREETRDLADHLTKRFRTILATRGEVRVTESGSAMHLSLAGLVPAEKAQLLGADYLLAGALRREEGRLRLSLQVLDKSGNELWEQGFESPLLYQAQLQEWVLDALWPQLPLDPQGLEGAKSLVADCHYPDDGMAILTLARTGRRGGGPALLAMVATADIEAGLLHLAQSEFYFRQLGILPESQRPVIEKLAMRSLGRAAASCPDHPGVELLRLLHTGELPLSAENAADYITRHPNSADLHLAVAELYGGAGSHRRARGYAGEAALLDPLGEMTQCRAKALLGRTGNEQPECP